MAGRRYSGPLREALRGGLINTILYYKRNTRNYQEWFGKVVSNVRGISFGDLSTATSMANAADKAGQVLAGMDPAGKLLIRDIPTNPYLFGGFREGNRFEYHVRIRWVDRRSGRQTWRSHIEASPVNLTKADLEAAAEAAIDAQAAKYPLKAGVGEDPEWYISGFEIVSVQKVF